MADLATISVARSARFKRHIDRMANIRSITSPIEEAYT
jgi:hypothetical protein